MPILYIEDEPIIAQAVCEHLTQNGLAFYLARSVKQAVELFKTHPIDFIVADFNLGDGTLEEIYRLSNPRIFDLPLVVMSAADDAQLMNFLSEVQLVQKLVKPIQVAELLKAIKNECEVKTSIIPRAMGPISPSERAAFIEMFTGDSADE